MKLPNKFGTVTKLSGKRRKPWIVKEGMSGKQKAIGYTATKEEGLIMLAQYNRDPWGIDTEKITFQKLYELWIAKRADKLGISNKRCLKSAYRHCSALYNLKYKQIKAFQMQDCIDLCRYGYSTQAHIKNLFGRLDDFAFELDIILKRNSDLLTSASVSETTKKPFLNEEVNRVWDNEQLEWADSVLFLLYTGFRISEMLSIESVNVDLDNNTIIGGIKTKAGKNRIVPIHSKIEHLVRRRKAEGHKYLFSHEENKISKDLYYAYWYAIMEKLQMQHTPHDCRHTFRSLLDSAGANKVCIDLMMGHKSKDVGERVYTHKTIEELKSNIELITN